MKRFLAAAFSAALLFAAASGCAGQRALRRFSGSFLDVFDTATTVVVFAKDETTANALVSRVHDALMEYHRLYDIYNDYDGLVNLKAVNERAAKAPVPVDARIFDLLAYGKKMYALTGGRVNIAFGSVLSLWHDAREKGLADPERAALPNESALTEAALHANCDALVLDKAAQTVYFSDPALRLDVGALAKGYAAQAVCDALRADGITGLLLSVGGNVCAVGGRTDGNWQVAVQSPSGEGYLAVLDVYDQSVVTSGTYERFYTVNGKRYHHIIDPDTLYPATYYTSVTVLANDSALADGLSTALFNLPLEKGLSLIESISDAEAMWLDANENRTYSSGFAAHVLSDS